MKPKHRIKSLALDVIELNKRQSQQIQSPRKDDDNFVSPRQAFSRWRKNRPNSNSYLRRSRSEETEINEVDVKLDRKFDCASPRLKAISNLLDGAEVIKVKRISRGGGSNTEIWKVNVVLVSKNLNHKNEYDHYEVYGSTGTLRDQQKTDLHISTDPSNEINFWEKELSVCCMKELELESSVESEVKSFLEEIDTLKRLPDCHNHIIRYIGFQQNEKYLRIFTKLYNGSLYDLLNELKKRGLTLSEKQIIMFCRQLLSALMVLHSRRMMHRDIKSMNIFYTGTVDDIDNITLVLGDFGESKVLYDLRAKTCVGTSVWMAPEVLQSDNTNSYTFAADVYSFGMVLYEMMTLNQPYCECKAFSSVMKIISGEKPPLSDEIALKYPVISELWKETTKLSPDLRPSSGKVYITLISCNK